MSAQTCTQPHSELATVSVGCGEVPEPVAGVAFKALVTCKQLTPQITAICDGVHYTTLLYLNIQAACNGVPMCYLEPKHATYCAQNCRPGSVHCTRGVPVQQSTPPESRNSTTEGGSPNNATARHRLVSRVSRRDDPSFSHSQYSVARRQSIISFSLVLAQSLFVFFPGIVQ
jgi:hypothetical protein